MQRQHASVLARSRALNDAPLLTAKHRDAAAAEREKRKADKWPTVSASARSARSARVQLWHVGQLHLPARFARPLARSRFAR